MTQQVFAFGHQVESKSIELMALAIALLYRLFNLPELCQRLCVFAVFKQLFVGIEKAGRWLPPFKMIVSKRQLGSPWARRPFYVDGLYVESIFVGIKRMLATFKDEASIVVREFIYCVFLGQRRLHLPASLFSIFLAGTEYLHEGTIEKG